MSNVDIRKASNDYKLGIGNFSPDEKTVLAAFEQCLNSISPENEDDVEMYFDLLFESLS